MQIDLPVAGVVACTVVCTRMRLSARAGAWVGTAVISAGWTELVAMVGHHGVAGSISLVFARCTATSVTATASRTSSLSLLASSSRRASSTSSSLSCDRRESSG